MRKVLLGAISILGLSAAAAVAMAGTHAIPGTHATAATPATAGTPAADAAPLDLDDPAVLQSLHRLHPAEFVKIELILAGLRARPQWAETDWLQVTFRARDVDLARYLFLTSLPPKQLLRFTLDNVRYRALVTRADLAAKPVRAR